jgi:hypothetical protein
LSGIEAQHLGRVESSVGVQAADSRQGPFLHTPEMAGKGLGEMGVQVSPTSMLPPTRARRGGRGLSLSLFSCLLDCRRPPGEQPSNEPSDGDPEIPYTTTSMPQSSRTSQDSLKKFPEGDPSLTPHQHQRP